MKLTKLKIEGFKCVKSVELDLADVNVLVGTNGSGKSSIIQAVHLACCVMRQAESVSTTSKTVGIEELDYLPTNDYKQLGHDTNWGNISGSPSSKANFTFERDEELFNAHCELRSARNAGISITGNVHSQLTDLLRRKRKFFSAYIPGISGIPNKEEKKSKKVILKACSYGDSNIILRNVLLLLKQKGEINIIEDWFGRIIGPVRIYVTHDDEHDLTIDCSVSINGRSKPIELIGMGYVQLIQILSYILLFEPGILLIDEPDTHLHPNVQEKLVPVLSHIASERNLKIIMTTHSPFIVRGCPSSSKVYWVNDGVIESENRQQVELALGWGAFGKKIIIVSEDSDTSLLRKLVSQWPELNKFVTYYPGTGYKNITNPQQAHEVCKALGDKFKILVHRDRDSLTDDEAVTMKQLYEEKGSTLWLPTLSDVEAYFCSSPFLQDFLGFSDGEADTCIDAIITLQAQTIYNMFKSQRAAHNKELYESGGSPTNDDVWAAFQTRQLKGAKGKFVFKQLKNRISGNAFREAAILEHNMQIELAPDLKNVLEQLLAD